MSLRAWTAWCAALALVVVIVGVALTSRVERRVDGDSTVGIHEPYVVAPGAPGTPDPSRWP